MPLSGYLQKKGKIKWLHYSWISRILMRNTLFSWSRWKQMTSMNESLPVSEMLNDLKTPYLYTVPEKCAIKILKTDLGSSLFTRIPSYFFTFWKVVLTLYDTSAGHYAQNVQFEKKLDLQKKRTSSNFLLLFWIHNM